MAESGPLSGSDGGRRCPGLGPAHDSTLLPMAPMIPPRPATCLLLGFVLAAVSLSACTEDEEEVTEEEAPRYATEFTAVTLDPQAPASLQLAWGEAEEHFLPKYVRADGVVGGLFPVNVPYLLEPGPVSFGLRAALGPVFAPGEPAWVATQWSAWFGVRLPT